MKRIAIAEAKLQLKRISDYLDSPLLLIGGLAIQQYAPTRDSQDIDLVCEFDIARGLVDVLFPRNEWTVVDENDDEYRPSFYAKHKHDDTLPVIKFGPKIKERGAYKFLDWDLIEQDAESFHFRTELLSNVRVPTAEALLSLIHI